MGKNLSSPPFQIVAAGICPQGLSAGQLAPNVVGCTVQNGGTGIWLLTALDPTIAVGTCALILSPGSGSNLPQGIAFGQSQQVGTAFSFSSYRNDTGAAIDIEIQFIIVRWPAAAE